MSIVSKNRLSRFYSGCMKISLVSNQNVASAARDLVQTLKKIYLLQTVYFPSDRSSSFLFRGANYYLRMYIT